MENKHNKQSGSRPLHMLAEERLLLLIEQGHYQSGDKLPPEPLLAQELGISRSTLREALRSFEEDGLVQRRAGIGTVIASPPPYLQSGLEVLESLDSIARRQGLEAGTTDLQFGRELANTAYQKKFGLERHDFVLFATRVKTIATKPVAYMYDVIPEKLATLEELQAGFQGSMMDFLLSGGVPVSYSRVELLPTFAPPLLARKLVVKKYTPLLLLEEMVYSNEGIPVEYSLNYFVRDYCKFHLIRRRPKS